jgi:hypothetical protein
MFKKRSSTASLRKREEEDIEIEKKLEEEVESKKEDIDMKDETEDSPPIRRQVVSKVGTSRR